MAEHRLVRSSSRVVQYHRIVASMQDKLDLGKNSLGAIRTPLFLLVRFCNRPHGPTLYHWLLRERVSDGSCLVQRFVQHFANCHGCVDLHVLGILKIISIDKVGLLYCDCSARRVAKVGIEIAVLLRGEEVLPGTAAPAEP